MEESKEEYTESIIEIPSSDRRDAALFTCLATNLYGKDSKNIQLLVQGAYTNMLKHEQGDHFSPISFLSTGSIVALFLLLSLYSPFQFLLSALSPFPLFLSTHFALRLIFSTSLNDCNCVFLLL